MTDNTIWDRQVPKDIEEGSGASALDTAGAPATPEYEPGEIDYSEIYDSGPLELRGGKMRGLVTYANTPVGYADTTYTPTANIKLKLGGSPRVYEPSVVAVGVSSPQMIDSTTGEWTSPSEQQWTQLQYAGMTLEQTVIESIGLVESGAETPWEEASEFLFNYAEPDAYEEDSNTLVPVGWILVARATFVVDVPGTIGEKTLSTD